MNVLDIGDDLLLYILTLCISQQAFTSLVCRSFYNILKGRDFPREKRFVNISSIFVSQACFNYAINNLNIINKVAELWKRDSLQITKWRSQAIDLAFSTAPLELLDNLFAIEFNTPESIRRRTFATGRKGLLDAKAGVIQDWCEGAYKTLESQGFRAHLIQTLFKELASITTNDTLFYVLKCINPITQHSRWSVFFSEFTYYLHAVVSIVSSSKVAYALLDALTGFVEASGHKEHGEFMCVFMVASASRTRSASAWRWLRDRCGKRSLQYFFDNYSAVCNQLGEYANLSVLGGGMHPMKLDSFKATEVEAYKVIRDGVREGGFLHDTFIQVVGPKLKHAYLVSSTIVNELSGVGGAHSRLSRHDAAEVLLESVYDLVSENAGDYEMSKSLQNIFYKLVQEFPYESYMVMKKFALQGNPLQKVLRFVYVSLNECILKGMSRVLEDAVNSRSVLQLDSFSEVDRANLLDSIIVQNKSGKVVVRMLKSYLPFCKVAIHQVSECLENGQFMEADELMKHCTLVQKIELGKEVVTRRLPSKRAVKLAFDHECFKAGSDYHCEALRIINDTELEEDLRKKRKLPFKALQKSIRFRG